MKSSLTLISFNIWDLPVPTNRTRHARVREIISYLKRLDPDVICLQEAWDPVHRRHIHDELGRGRYQAPANENIASRWYPFFNGTGGLLTLSKYPVASEAFVPFKGLTFSLTDWLGNKGFLESKLETPWGDLTIINTHVCHLSSTARQPLVRRRFSQFSRLLDHTQQSAGQPLVMAGDFNEDDIMEQPQFAARLERSDMAHPASTASASVYTYRHDNPFVTDLTPSPDSSCRFDYFFVRGLDRLRLRVERYEPLYVDPAMSDHDPVILTLSQA